MATLPTVTGVVVAVLVTTVTSFVPHPAPLHNSLHYDERANDFPCPSEEDIDPCVCEYDTTKFTLNLDCQGVDTDQLNKVFSAYFPVKVYTKLQLSNSEIPTLEDDAFHGVSFQTVVMTQNNMRTVSPGALRSSYDTLQNFYIIENSEEVLSWPLSDLDSFTSLENIGITGSYGDVIPLNSETLSSVTLYMYELSELPAGTFSQAPALKIIRIQNTKLNTIEANTFVSLPSLETLLIENANIPTLGEMSLAFASATLKEVNLPSNNITIIEPTALQGVSGAVDIILKDNNLTQLQESPFLELLKGTTGTIDITGNPLQCGCDLRWLVDVTDEDWSRVEGLASSCPTEESYSKDTLKDFLEYQCSSPPDP